MGGCLTRDRDLPPMELRYRAAIVLRSVRAFMTLKELSGVLGLPQSIISRYANMRLLPSRDSAQRIMDSLLSKKVLAGILMKRITASRPFKAGTVYDITAAAGDPNILNLVGEYVCTKSGGNFDAVIAPEVGGITFATAVSMVSRKPLIIARRSKVASEGFLEIPVYRDPTAVDYYYIKSVDLERARKVLIVDDFGLKGSTLSSFVERLEAAGKEVTGVYLMIGIGSDWKKAHPLADAILEIEL